MKETIQSNDKGRTETKASKFINRNGRKKERTLMIIKHWIILNKIPLSRENKIPQLTKKNTNVAYLYEINILKRRTGFNYHISLKHISL